MQHLSPLSSPSSSSSRHDQRLRVREMLRNVRQHQLNQLSAPVDTHNDLASSIQANTSLASAAAFGDVSTRGRLLASPNPATSNLTNNTTTTAAASTEHLMIGGGASIVGAAATNARSSQAAEICVLLASIAAFTFVFVVVGQCVDAALGDDSDSDDKQQQSYATLVCKVVGQMLLNVALLVVPYIVLAKYAGNSLVCRYYAIVAAFWVVSLHAQSQLRIRFRHVLQGDTKTAAEHKQEQKQNDVHALAKHLADAAEAAKQKEQKRQQQQHLHDPLHREPMPFVHNAPPPRNERLQPHADLLPPQSSPISSGSSSSSAFASLDHHTGGASNHNGLHEGMMNAPPSTYDASPVQFNSNDLMQPRETDISELLR